MAFVLLISKTKHCHETAIKIPLILRYTNGTIKVLKVYGNLFITNVFQLYETNVSSRSICYKKNK